MPAACRERLPEGETPTHVTVARILRARGRRGEVAAEILTDFRERLTRLIEAELVDSRGARRRVAIRSCWLSQSRGGQAIFHFEGCDSIGDAEKLAGCEIQVPISARQRLPAGSYYITDLMGCEVFDGAGAPLGVVRDVQLTGEEIAGTPLLLLDAPQGELMIPLAGEICVEIDVAARRIEAILPEGLLDLNRSG